jgi:hypothetical protein
MKSALEAEGKERLIESAFIGWQIARSFGATIKLSDYLVAFGLIDPPEPIKPEVLAYEKQAALAKAEEIRALDLGTKRNGDL